MGKKATVGTQVGQRGGETQDAGTASQVLGATPPLEDPPHRSRDLEGQEPRLGRKGPAPSRTGTHGTEVGRRRHIRDSGSQAQWGSWARTQSIQLL